MARENPGVRKWIAAIALIGLFLPLALVTVPLVAFHRWAKPERDWE